MPLLDVAIDHTGLIIVTGEVDTTTAAAFSDAIEASTGAIRIDLAGCGFMDSTGIAVLVDARSRAAAGNASVTLVSPSRPVCRLLDICAMSALFEIEHATPLSA